MSAAAVPSEGALRSDLRSPANGQPLRADTPHSLDDGAARQRAFDRDTFHGARPAGAVAGARQASSGRR